MTPRMRNQQGGDPFERMVGRLDRILGRAENRLRVRQNRPRDPHNRALEEDTPGSYFTCMTRRNDQPDSYRPEQKQYKQSTDPQIRAFHQALENCQKTYIVVEKLHQLLTDLLKLESRSLASECNTDSSDSRTIVLSDMLECVVMRDLDTEQHLTGPQRIHQMKRISMWKCDEIKDELRDLQITSRYGKALKTKAERLFVKRWDLLPVQKAENIHIDCAAPAKLEQVEIEQLLEGTIIEDAVLCVMTYWPTLEREFHERQLAYRSAGEKTAEYGLDKLVLLDMLDLHPKSPIIRAKTARRCTCNIETVRRALNDLIEEARDEYLLRKSCGRRSPQPGHNRDHNNHLCAVEVMLQCMIGYLSKAEYWAKNLATPSLMEAGERFYEPCSRQQIQAIQDWSNLSENGLGGLVTLSLEEVVEKLVRKPLAEDEVTGEDPILRHIPYYLQPRWKSAF